MSKLFIPFLLFIILISCNAEQENKNSTLKKTSPAISNKYLDSLYNEYKSLKIDDNNTRYLLYSTINNFVYVPDSTSKILENTINELRLKNDIPGLVLFFEIKADLFHNRRKYNLALKYFDSCIILAKKIGDMNALGNIYYKQQSLYWEMNLIQRRVKSLYKAIECYKKSGNLDREGGMYFELGNCCFLNQKYNQAYQAFLRSTHRKDSFNNSIGWIFAARSLIKTGDLKLAGECIIKGRGVINSPLIFQPFYYYFTYGTWLSAMNRKEEALRIFEMAVPLAVKGGQIYQKAATLSEMADIYIDLKRIDKAKKIIKEAVRIADSVDVLRIRMTARRVLSKYYEAVGENRKALEEYKISIKLNDSLNYNEISSALASSALEAEYNNKDALRIKLQQKRDEIEAKKLRRQKLIAYISLAFLLFIGLIALLSWRNNRQMKKVNSIIKAEKKRSDDLLLNILPAEVAEELKSKGSADAKHFDMVTVLFTDFKDFTQISETMTPTELVGELNTFFKAFDNIITRLKIEKIKTIGDSYMCVGGLPFPSDSHAESVLNAGLEIQKFVEQHSEERLSMGLIPMQIRIGIHSGPVVAGIVGFKKYAYDIWGDTVNTASRMESSGEAGKVNISSSTYELIKDKFICTTRGKVIAKHKGDMEMYFVERRA